MGVALFAALDGREQLATPPEVADILAMKDDGTEIGVKTSRVIEPRQIVRAKDRRRLEVATVNRVGDKDVIGSMPVMQVKMALAAGYKTSRSYPAYDPAEIARDDKTPEPVEVSAPQIYGAKAAESDMILQTIDFPMETAVFDEQSDLSAAEVEKVVRQAGPGLTEGDVQLAAMHYVDPQRFGGGVASIVDMPMGTPENVTVSLRGASDETDPVYAEDIIPFTAEGRIDVALENAGYATDQTDAFADRIANTLNGSELRAGSVLRVGLEVRGETPKIVRVSVYDGTRHILTVASNDSGKIAQAEEPEPNPELLTAFDDAPPVPARGALPSFYDGIYRAAFSNGMSRESTRQLVRVLSNEVELQSRVGRADRLEVLFTQPGEQNEMSDGSQLVYLAATFGGKTRKFYRHQFADGSVEFFDANGRTNRPSMLRNPIPSGKFRSGFGSRRHPILGYVRMHTGTDWAAPTGTPIIAAGDAVVEKAGWSSGYGKQTILKHANGYETSYNHQSRIAVRPGQKVQQGQVIGYVGTTGLSTGAHLHYEVIVNGIKVDPMRVRLPSARSLSGKELARFKRERDRIDDLVGGDESGTLRMASARQ